jgi:predicted Zn finger-like uncharacterized protein
MPDMKLAEGIRKHGFRKWYERQLLKSHAHLALTFVCMVGIFAAVEAATLYHSLTDQLTDALAVILCAGIGLWALRRYLSLLARAEAVANQADCPGCKAYGRMELLQADAGSEDVQVRCRRCSHVWRIDGYES